MRHIICHGLIFLDFQILNTPLCIFLGERTEASSPLLYSTRGGCLNSIHGAGDLRYKKVPLYGTGGGYNI